MQEQIQEYIDSRGVPLQVDREASVLRGVKLLGLVSRNGRRYLQTALAEAATLYEKTKVNVNHATAGPLTPRNYQDRLGVIQNVRLREGEGLYGDLHFNPKHAVAEQLLWDAENAPENVGLSHNVLAKTSKYGEETVVETITQVQCVDLVADPATTRGLFEQESVDAKSTTSPLPNKDESDEAEEAITTEEIEATIPAEQTLERRERVYELLAEHELPLPGVTNRHAQAITSEEFLASLWAAPNETTVRRLIEARAAVVQAARMWRYPEAHGMKPVACDQHLATERGLPKVQNSSEEFVAAITS